MKRYYVTFLILLLIGWADSHKILPHPKKITLGNSKLTIANPCEIIFVTENSAAIELF
jgi:hypothetical protein